MTLPISSFLGLVKCTRMDLFEGQTYIASICSPSSLFLKNNWGTRKKWRGKIEPNFSCVGSMWLLNMTRLHFCQAGDISFCHSRLHGFGYLFLPLIYSLPCHHDLRSLDVKYCQIQSRVTDMFKRIFNCSFRPPSDPLFGPDSLSSCSSISCRLCGKHYDLL